MSNIFGDDDPRDAWDDGDHPEIKREVLVRITQILKSDNGDLREWVARKRAELDG